MIFMRLTVVGCAGSFPGPDSPASCYLLEADGFRLVIDFGNGSLGALQKYTGLFDIDAVCLSHLHADHCADMTSLVVNRRHAPAVLASLPRAAGVTTAIDLRSLRRSRQPPREVPRLT